jgi:hypothetical protein
MTSRNSTRLWHNSWKFVRWFERVYPAVNAKRLADAPLLAAGLETKIRRTPLECQVDGSGEANVSFCSPRQ